MNDDIIKEVKPEETTKMLDKRKIILLSLLVVVFIGAIIVWSQLSKDPILGKWESSQGTNNVTLTIKSNNVVVLEIGSEKEEGTWEKVDGKYYFDFFDGQWLFYGDLIRDNEKLTVVSYTKSSKGDFVYNGNTYKLQTYRFFERA